LLIAHVASYGRSVCWGVVSILPFIAEFFLFKFYQPYAELWYEDSTAAEIMISPLPCLIMATVTSPTLNTS